MIYTSFSIGIVSAAFLIYLYIGSAGFFTKFFFKKFNPESAQARQIIFNRILGLVLFGFVPVFFVQFFGLPVTFFNISLLLHSKVVWLVVALLPVPVIVNYFVARTPDNLQMYPQIRVKNWTPGLKFMSSLTWVVYLLGYEIMLRGVLLYACLSEMELWPAIIINTSIYALIHIPKGMKETIGSIPMGILLCIVTYYSGSFWAAFFIHCSLALSNEWFSIYYAKHLNTEAQRHGVL